MNIEPQHGDSRVGKTMLWLAAIGVLAGLTAIFQFSLGTSSGVENRINDGGQAMIVLQRDRSGHYFAEGEINGRPVMFLLDTGATDVALPEKMAREIGLKFGPLVPVMTAAGQVSAWRTRLDRVSLGDISMTNVSAMITRGSMEEVLLGMSFLKHFTLRQQGDELIIESGSVSSSQAIGT